MTGKWRESVLVKLGVCAALAALTAMMNGCSNKQEKKGNMRTNENDGPVAEQTHELTLTDANFATETSKGVVLVDFWAPWCGPCLMQGPILEKVAATMLGKANVGKCNVDEASETAARFGIRSIPTLIVLTDGKEVERFVGVQQQAALIAVLKKHAAQKQ
jgi:thioredoxin 1